MSVPQTHDVRSPASGRLMVVLLVVLASVLALGGVILQRWRATQPKASSLTTAVVFYPEEIDKHLARGADVNEVNPEGMTPLIAGVISKKHDSVRKLIEAGADPNVAGTDGRTPLVWASRFSVNTAGVLPEQIDTALLLLEAGADPNVVDPGLDHTPLHYAVRTGEVTFLRKLIEAGADLNARAVHGRSPLHTAVQEHSPVMAAELIDAGAEVDVPDANRSTPLFRACMTGQPDIVELLLKAGASPDVENEFGRRPSDWARQPQFRELFEQYTKVDQESQR